MPLPSALCRWLAPVAALLTACGSSDVKQGAANADTSTAAAAPSVVAAAPTPATTTRVDETAIIVNGLALSAETVQLLQQVYPVAIPAGRYWYDGVSGAWGVEGEPIAGQMIPGLSLGGPLAMNASRGTSGVFINGRQITIGEKLYIERICQTPVAQARYWIMASGIGGYEGGPAIFALGQCPGLQQQGGGGARSMSRTYCDANGACTSTGILGSITTARM